MVPNIKPILQTSLYGVGSPEIAAAPGWPVVLYFHHISPEATKYTDLTPKQFGYALDLMLECFRPLHLSAITGWNLAEATKVPSFVVTLDDGYIDNWQWAVPVLESRRLRAIFFVVAGEVGRGSARMNWSHLAQLASAGHVIGSHSMTHRKLTDLTPSEIATEMSESLQLVKHNTGIDTLLLAYPFGCVPREMPDSPEIIGFGTVRTTARPWSKAKHNIRRTYLPSTRDELWRGLICKWRDQWDQTTG